MGPSHDGMSRLATPIITVTPPTSPRESVFRSASSDLETIEESECPTNYQQKRSPTKLLAQVHEWSPPCKDCNDEHASSSNDDELDKLKSMATRLRLRTRRPSYVEWCENLPKIRDLNGNMRKCDCGDDEEDDWSSFNHRQKRLDENIQWVRTELMEMKSQDHQLAIQLMRLRSEIQQLKLQKSSNEYRELIDTAAECAQERRDQHPAVCDLPFRRDNSMIFALEKPLKDFGVTRLNLFARRFSLL